MFADSDGGTSVEQLIDPSYTSRVSEIFNVILKSLGIELDFVDDDEVLKTFDDDVIKEHTLDGHVYFCTDYQFFLIERTNEIRQEILSEYPIMSETALKELTEDVLKRRKYINGPLNEELGNLNERVEEESKLAYEKMIDELRNQVSDIVEEPEEEKLTEIKK